MRLTRFRVKNYRSVNDSGSIEVRDRTALVGRNESGKTNLLLALASLKPPGGMEELTFVKDFPRDRLRDEFSENITVLETAWELTDREMEDLTDIFPRARGVREVTVSRRYQARRAVGFVGLPALAVDANMVSESLSGIQRSVNASLRGKDADASTAIKGTFEELSGALSDSAGDPGEWAEEAATAVRSFRSAVGALDPAIPDNNADRLAVIEAHAEDIRRDEEAYKEARNWVGGKLPIFVYLSEYAQLDGHQDISAFLHRRAQGPRLESDENFDKLVKVAGLDPAELNNLLARDHEERQQLANRASAVTTRKIRELWTERQLTVRFNLDAQYFDTLISDPNSVYPVDVNLNERSRGFKWFFSFYITFAADTAGGPAENAILLLDEPGLYLHALAQRNLLDLFKNDFENQIVYTTHSPFMIPTEDLSSIRTVNISPEEGTTVTNDPTGDRLTLFPLQAALGYDITQTLFVGANNLVVEGVSDFWYLSSVSEYLVDRSGNGLSPELVITPAGGAQRVSYMVALLAAQNLKVLVLLDDERQARDAAEELVKSKLIRDQNVVFVSEAFSSPPDGGADVEDLLDPEVYGRLVEETYSRELGGRRPALNDQIPRIVKRYEEAFQALGMNFHKTRPAKLFLRRIAENPDSVMTENSQQRFEELFDTINRRLADAARGDRSPFL
jgi:energy-coupling factor transporter ATP-binding protein EcfA2